MPLSPSPARPDAPGCYPLSDSTNLVLHWTYPAERCAGSFSEAEALLRFVEWLYSSAAQSNLPLASSFGHLMPTLHLRDQLNSVECTSAVDGTTYPIQADFTGQRSHIEVSLRSRRCWESTRRGGERTLAPMCGGHSRGQCVHGGCVCLGGFGGADCEVALEDCRRGGDATAILSADGLCLCSNRFAGRWCSFDHADCAGSTAYQRRPYLRTPLPSSSPACCADHRPEATCPREDEREAEREAPMVRRARQRRRACCERCQYAAVGDETWKAAGVGTSPSGLSCWTANASPDQAPISGRGASAPDEAGGDWSGCGGVQAGGRNGGYYQCLKSAAGFVLDETCECSCLTDEFGLPLVGDVCQYDSATWCNYTQAGDGVVHGGQVTPGVAVPDGTAASMWRTTPAGGLL
ncbi:hypothetical protein CYMTET_8501 [Cymbomonas tetramitiformis]|uniref:EGF-like domain-containing protein n=1 Tax=Cymbomonas tetramitiformis TaxID=36881 RepID=A0AAE0LGF0_9CHLO|nr:hypothetical protein CYMTET_8501 [Cymbomonas tetramitiformis]